MTATDPDDDTPQRHDHGPRNLALGLTALALASGAAYSVNARFEREHEAHERQRAADAWSDLSRSRSRWALRTYAASAARASAVRPMAGLRGP